MYLIHCLHIYALRVHSHAPSIRSYRMEKVGFPDFQPMKVSEEPVCIDIFRENPVFTSLHLRSPVHVVPPQRVRFGSVRDCAANKFLIESSLYSLFVKGHELVREL